MKKFLLLFVAWGAVLSARSQVIFYVQNPPVLEGNYDLTYASTGWGVVDMTNPANAIQGTLVFVDDGTAADSLGCNSLTNGAQVSGKIAVVYRGDCEFGTKALNAQNAGAIGVIIINNAPGAPIAIGPGADGINVTIPTIMTTDVAGALLRSQIIAGNVTAFIGSKTGFYSDDIGFLPKDIVMPISSSISSVVSQNAGEFDIPLGAWVHNYGQDPQTGVRLSANIKKGLSTLYTQTSSPVTIAPGDSAFIQLPTFSQSSYALGYYDLNYSVSSDSTDDFMADNKKTSDFVMSDTLFAAGLLDSVTYFPQTQAGYQPANMSGEFQACLHFKDSLAGRLAVDGMYFTATANTGDTLLGLEIETVVYRWDNEFTDLNDPNFAFDNMIDLSYGSYVFAGPEDGQRVFASFTPPVILENNKRYLFCVKYDDPVAFIGYSTQSDYETTVDYHLQPISPTSSDGTWYALGFGTDLVPSISVRMFDKNLLGVEEEPITQIVPYPNPASEVLNIPIKDISGKIRVDVMDLSGKIVSTTQANMDTPGNLAVNVDGLSSGQYMFRMITEDNTIRTFKVVITK